jgi:hypothetical protein
MRQTKPIKLTPRKFEDLSPLKYSLATCPTITWRNWEQMKCLVTAFQGECGRGVDGDGGDYAGFMSVIIKAAIEAWDPVALILDLRELKYEWGDELTLPLHAPFFDPGKVQHQSFFGNRPKLAEGGLNGVANKSLAYPMAVVISDLNRTGLTSLVKDELSLEESENTINSSDLVATLEDAWENVDQRLQKIFQKA